MKVLQINSVNQVGSTGRICTEITNYLNKNGMQGYIAYSKGLETEHGYKIGSPIETKMHGLFSRITGLQAYYSKKSTKRLLKYIEEIKPDVIHLHNLHANYINIIQLLQYIAEKNIPTVLTLHDCWFFTGKCCHYTVEGCYKWKTQCFRCPCKHKDNKSWFFDRTSKMYNDKKTYFSKIPRLAVVGVSDWITNEAKASLLASAKIITRIYNWVDLELFRPVFVDNLKYKLGIQDKFIILGVASGWSNAKGLHKFIELSELIPEDMIIVLVGKVHSVCLPSNIIHIDEIHNVHELVKYYSMADVFVNLSLEETFGKVTAEALACGTPVIVFNSTANPELVGKGCGYIVHTNSTPEVMKKVLNIKINGKKTYSQNCIDFAKNNFNMQDRIFDYVQLYKKIINCEGIKTCQ